MRAKVIEALLNTTKNYSEVLKELEVDVDVEDVLQYIEQCSHCSTWKKIEDLSQDLDENPTCNICLRFYGY